MNSVKFRLNLYILLIVLLSTLLITTLSLFNSKKLIKAQVETEKRHVTNIILKDLNCFQNTITFIENQIYNTLEQKMAQTASDLVKTYTNPNDIPIDLLKSIASDLGMDHVFLIDSLAIIRNTTLPQELNYDLKTEGEEFYKFFRELFNSNKFQIYSWGISSADNELTIYCYYVPHGASYMFETSVSLQNYLDRFANSNFDISGLQSIKNEIPQNTEMLVNIDLYNWNDAYKSSILRKGHNLELSEDEMKQLRNDQKYSVDTKSGEIYFEIIAMKDNDIKFLPDLILKAELNYSEQDRFIKQILWFNVFALLVVFLLVAISSPVIVDHIFINKIETINYNLNALRFANYEALKSFKGGGELATIDENIHHVKNAFVEREKQLNDAKVMAESADKLKTAFLANMSHEIRTPLNAIVGFSQLLRDANPSPEDVERFTGLINTNSQNLLQIINDIIDLAHIESGQLKIASRPVCLKEMFNELFGYTKSKLHGESLIYNDKNIKTYLDNDFSKTGTCIVSDPYRLRQIMEQLIDNAIKFTCKGEIHMGFNVVNENIELYVSDTGVGINESDMGKIFDRFVQAEDFLTREFGGTGLGLAICNELAKLLNGSIKVKSEIEKGSTFSIVLPYIKSAKNTV